MSWYPQLRSGSSVQLPFTRRRKWRRIENALESGELVYLDDTHGGVVRWQMTYELLSDSEVSDLKSFFMAARGKYGTFGFADPLVNLAGGSEDLSRTEWSAGTMSRTGSNADPVGGTSAWLVSNSSAGMQELQQTIQVPGAVCCCFSFWVRSLASAAVVIRRDSVTTTVNANSNWRRVWLSGTGSLASAASTFAVQVPAGASIEVWGFQIETQPFPGKYMAATVPAGVYLNTSFDQDELEIVATAPGLSSCNVKLISRL